jgi:hypothetical protein
LLLARWSILSASSSSDRPSKLRKLNEFRRHLPHVSASALAAVLEEIAKHGVPELHHNRRQLWEATTSEMTMDTPYGTLLTHMDLVTKTGRSLNVCAVNRLALLWKAVQQGGSFTSLLYSTLLDKPSTYEEPWSLIAYADEVVPGNQLSHDNRRKMWVIYISWLEFGAQALQKEESWLCVFSGRSINVNKAAAGISQVFGSMLKMFFGSLGFNIRTGGIVLQDNENKSIRFFSKLGMILQDGGAHKLIWNCTFAIIKHFLETQPVNMQQIIKPTQCR